jgi:hypothetical protein
VYSLLQRFRYLVRLVLPKTDGGLLEGLGVGNSRYNSEYLARFGGDATGYVTHYLRFHGRTAQALSYGIADVVQLCIISTAIGSLL